jgi:hypothetical protein
MVAAAAVAFAPPASGQGPGDDGLLPPGDWTEEQQMFLHDLIERTEAALPAFGNPDELAAMGFVNFGVTAPGGWDHWTNQAWIDDEHVLDPEHPESLVFRYTDNGGYELEAAMFFLPSQYDLTNIPDEFAWLPGWHTHPELCVWPDGTFAGLANGDGTCSSGAPSDMPPMMHVWITHNACDHRFGGVGVGGLDCDVSHDHGPTTTEHDDHGTTTTEHDDDRARRPRPDDDPARRPRRDHDHDRAERHPDPEATGDAEGSARARRPGLHGVARPPAERDCRRR